MKISFWGFSDHLICWQVSMDSLPEAKGSFSPAVWTPSFHMNFKVIANHRFLGTGEEYSILQDKKCEKRYAEMYMHANIELQKQILKGSYQGHEVLILFLGCCCGKNNQPDSTA